MARTTLEVIVQSLADARAAENGGADRLEVVRSIVQGGLTPAIDLVHEIAAAVRLPMRVMVRENAGFAIDDGELCRLQDSATALEAANVDGIVIGFADRGRLRLADLECVLSAAARVRVTFHRAFDELEDPIAAIPLIAGCAQVDRILTSGGNGPLAERVETLQRYSKAAGRLTIVAGGGVTNEAAAMFARSTCVDEIHIGRAARADRRPGSAVSERCVAAVRALLDRTASSPER